MVHYYYYVSAGAQCDAQTKIYKVAVGTNKQSQRDYAFLLAYAQQHGHYFEIVSRNSDTFIMNLRRSLAEYDVQLEWLSCRDLSALLRSVVTSPLKPTVLHGAHLQRKSLDLNYRISSNLARRASAPAKRSRIKTQCK